MEKENATNIHKDTNIDNETETVNEKNDKNEKEDIIIEKSEIDILKEENEKEKQLSKEYLDKLQRSMAEFDNFRKRTNSEKSAMFENGVIFALEKLLPILDNFERAMTTVSEEEKNSPIFIGVDMIFKQMSETFKNMGLEELPSEGEIFDPNIHNAVLHIDDETFGENTVAEVLQKGYKYKEKVIRPSMVKVAN